MIQENKDFLLFSTTGSSMFPFIRWNEEILVRKEPPENIRIGDIVLFQSDKGIKVCHRIVKIEDKDGTLWFQTKGDRGKLYDPPVDQQAVLGKAIAVKRKMRLIELHREEFGSFLYRFVCFFTHHLFSVRKFLVKVISFIQQCTLYQIILKPILRRNIEFKMSNEDINYKFFVTKNNRIIAKAYLNYSDNPHPGWWMWSLRVEPLYRRLGIGKELVKNLIEFTRQKDARSFYLEIDRERLAAIKFYESLGFSRMIGSEKWCEEPKRTLAYMKMDLWL